MIFSKHEEFSNAQAITASAASTNVYDSKTAGDAEGHEMFLHVQVTEDFATGTSLTIALQTDSDDAFGSPTALYTSDAIVTASLVAGYRAVRVRIPAGAERYLRVYYTVGGANFTAGKVDAFLSHDADTNDFNV